MDTITYGRTETIAEVVASLLRPDCKARDWTARIAYTVDLHGKASACVRLTSPYHGVHVRTTVDVPKARLHLGPDHPLAGHESSSLLFLYGPDLDGFAGWIRADGYREPHGETSVAVLDYHAGPDSWSTTDHELFKLAAAPILKAFA